VSQDSKQTETETEKEKDTRYKKRSKFDRNLIMINIKGSIICKHMEHGTCRGRKKVSKTKVVNITINATENNK
jgi:hypothetical protein